MNYVNLTPHDVVFNDGRVFTKSGSLARVSASFSEPVDDVSYQCFGKVEGLPEPQPNTRYIVSGIVLAALSGTRPDVVAPATGHPAAVRTEDGKGFKSVPCFVQ